ncbi:hypothetical protein N657DRAFT_643977 [Parathielavia appendiculata]|uniref:Response regulatory domain-containing protein n=1 Tax=Parathielavia appendiculata TaxID=2587402 RepID=A0AAN6Z4W2_9PEZI|nr:hypothetical protein N657DRAFT_643977 [Parathielavia appendiculata]
MGDLKSKLRAKISRRHSGIPPLPSNGTGNQKSNISSHSAESDSAATGGRAKDAVTGHDDSHIQQSTSTPGDQLTDKQKQDAEQNPSEPVAPVGDAASGKHGGRALPDNAANSVPVPASATPGDGHGLNRNDPRTQIAGKLSSDNRKRPDPSHSSSSSTVHPAAAAADQPKPRVSTDAARNARLNDRPVSAGLSSSTSRPAVPAPPSSAHQDLVEPVPNAQLPPSNPQNRPPGPPRRQSLLPGRQTTLIRTLLNGGQLDDLDQGVADQLLPISATMVTRKLWVKRPGASATIVTINEEDLVDDVRELILRKYANSLGRQFDAPDLTLRIVPREGQRQERVLGPEEPIARTLDAYFPGGQTVDEALLIDVPHRRTPRVSPRNGPPHAQHITSVSYEDIRPLEASTDYFGPGAIAHIPVTIAGAPNGPTHAISVINTGHVPQIPSPGGTRPRQYRERSDRPRVARQHTSSPTILNVVGAGGHPATLAVASSHEQVNAQAAPPAPPLPTPPTHESTAVSIPRTGTPPPRASSPRPPATTRQKKKKPADPPTLPAGMLNGGVPPINVLIVEDNIINLRLLEAFVKRLKVRWETAMNGREAVNKWRGGGFHLVLMDIQLPVMSGLEATREIRRLERMNSIGAFSTANSNADDNKGDEADEPKSEIAEEDKLEKREMFKSPVIIVALTASSLQSDRHEALAAGCNDFLTKPVTYVWLERKVMEWGCMQALIDFDGWRKWKSYSQDGVAEESSTKKAKSKKNRAAGAPNSSSSDGQ